MSPRPVELTLDDLVSKFERVELAASTSARATRAASSRRVSLGRNGPTAAIGNARWTGVRLKDVLDSAGVNAGAVAVRCNGLETGLLPATPNFKRSIAIDQRGTAR